MIRRAAVLGVVVLGMCVTAVSATADRPPSSPVGFVMTHSTCPSIPAGTTITGSGNETAIEVDHGPLAFSVVSHATGTATDNHGNSYVFDYSNAFRVASSDGGITFTGTMTDHFSLAGPAGNLTNGFIANVTFGPGNAFHADFINSRGDPIDSSGNAHCDPL